MDKLQALTALRDKVKAGTCVMPDDIHESPLPFSVERYIVNAYNGSLDAALTLHKAVLPEWDWSYAQVTAHCILCHPSNGCVDAHDDNPALAWLLAILEALIAQEGKNNEA